VSAAAVLFLSALALLPWASVPPFPWLHPRAQWCDALLLAATLAWLLERGRRRDWPGLRPVHAALGLYLVAATASLLHADPTPPAGPAKLLGLASLAAWAVLTADWASRPAVAPHLARVVAVTSLLAAGAAVAGVVLAVAGVPTPLVGTYGDLVPGAYARAQAGLTHPNLLASFCVFASAVVSRDGAGLPPALRRVTRIALAIAVLLTFSRGVLAFVLAALIRRGRRGRASGWPPGLFAVAAAALLVALTVWPIALDPSRPWDVRIDPGPSVRWRGLVTSLEAAARRPLLGIGPGRPAGTGDGPAFDAHCTPVNVAATLGLPALAAFLCVPLALWRGRPRPTDLATWGGLAGIGLDALAQDVEDFRHVWVLFGLAAARPAPGRDVVPSLRET
jgi:hypothetical protein